jgi:hypothetical protein
MPYRCAIVAIVCAAALWSIPGASAFDETCPDLSGQWRRCHRTHASDPLPGLTAVP